MISHSLTVLKVKAYARVAILTSTGRVLYNSILAEREVDLNVYYEKSNSRFCQDIPPGNVGISAIKIPTLKRLDLFIDYNLYTPLNLILRVRGIGNRPFECIISPPTNNPANYYNISQDDIW